jgi:hypothetical protein
MFLCASAMAQNGAIRRWASLLPPGNTRRHHESPAIGFADTPACIDHSRVHHFKK